MKSESNSKRTRSRRRSGNGTECDTTLKLDGVPVSFVLRPLFRKGSDKLVEIETDLLVIERHEHTYFGGGPKDIDASLDGALTEALRLKSFTGALGEKVVIELPDRKIKNVLIVGVGESGVLWRSTFCGFIGLLIDTAQELGVRKITIPIFPGRFDEMSLEGSLAVLRCRLAQVALRPGALGNLKEIELLSTPQAKRFIVDGLTVTRSLCSSCSNPRLTIV